MKIRLSEFERQTLGYVLFCVGPFSPSADLVDENGKHDLICDRMPDLVLSEDEQHALNAISQKLALDPFLLKVTRYERKYNQQKRENQHKPLAEI